MGVRKRSFVWISKIHTQNGEDPKDLDLKLADAKIGAEVCWL